MQRQIDTTRAQNQLLAARLRQVASAYQSTLASPMSLGGSGIRGPLRLGGSLATSSLGALSRATTRSSTAKLECGHAGQPNPVVAYVFLREGHVAKWTARGSRLAGRSLRPLGNPRARANWLAGMMTIADQESTFRADLINLADTNAHGPRQADGGPLHATRGPWQLTAETIARYHQPGTSNSIWDPASNASASMNYQMGRYGVDPDGHNARSCGRSRRGAEFRSRRA